MAGDIFTSADPESLLIRSTGILAIPGATAGNVLTVQADDTIAAAPGGFPPARNVGQASYDGTTITGSPIAPGTSYVVFVFSQGDSDLCTVGTYSGQSAVFPAENGTYAWTLRWVIAWATTVVDGANTVSLQLDQDYFGVNLINGIPVGGTAAAGGSQYGCASGTWWADSGSPTQVQLLVGNTAGNEPSSFATELWVQRLA